MRNIKRFAAIEGLRAWLAWTVVLDHVAYFSNLRGSLGHLLRGAGYPAVTTLIIISGFGSLVAVR